MNYYAKNILLVKGDTYSSTFEINDLNQELDTAIFNVKEGLNNEDEILICKSLEDGISVVGENNDLSKINYVVRLAPEDTKDLQSGIYYYELKIGVNSDIFTIMKGEFILLQNCEEEES